MAEVYTELNAGIMVEGGWGKQEGDTKPAGVVLLCR
jgi:hypothetical protein